MIQRHVKCFAKSVHYGVLGVGLLTAVLSCSRQDESFQKSSSTLFSLENTNQLLGLEKLSFAEWCSRWGLICPGSNKVSDQEQESYVESQDVLKWKAVAELIAKALASGSQFSLEQQELNSARVRIFMSQIGWSDVLGDILDVLTKSGLKKISLDPSGRVRFEGRSTLNGQSGAVRGKSGMKWAFENEGEFAVGTAGQYLFKGLQFSAASSFDSDEFGLLNFDDTDKTVWSGNNLAVTHVPDGFLIGDIPVRWEKFNELKQEVLIRNATEARSIVLNNNRNLKLNSEFFDTAAKHVGVFVEDTKVADALSQLVNSLGSFDMRAPSSAIPMAQVALQQASNVVCRIEMSGTPAIDVTLGKRFGIQNLFSNDKSNAQIDLYGINIKARVGLPISFNLKRVDIEPTRIVVKGIPVVGEISIPLPGSADKPLDKELKKFECSERL